MRLETNILGQLIGVGMDALWTSMRDNGGHGVFAGISNFFDNEEKRLCTGSSLSAVKSAAASLNTAHMSVTSGRLSCG